MTFLLWLIWTLVVFGGGVWCGWEYARPVVSHLEAETLRRRLRITQRAWDAERAIWRTSQQGRRR